eukprot:CAMPEP_0174237282 /NCGR_PEP_ID=MMETSP0417-20130205/7690_1 /TAXON_ID=242541 /ORGANISM="Mayorella sp, Strain BSH-02190019" /LENGTH=1523 /DNA_ID=CAMNT_0015316021 /DNA_START=21 /DNA_END=4592 /DNA_ORIENTATION=+
MAASDDYELEIELTQLRGADGEGGYTDSATESTVTNDSDESATRIAPATEAATGHGQDQAKPDGSSVPMASSTRLHRLRRSAAPSWASALDMRELYAVPDSSDEDGEGDSDSEDEADALHPDKLAQAQPPLPMLKANFLSYLSYWWVTSLMYTGYKRTLEYTDLWRLAPSESATVGRESFLRNWRNQPEGNPSIFRTFLRTSWKGLLMASIWNLFSLAFAICGPGFVLKYFLRWLGDDTQPAWEGFIWATALFATNLLQAVSFHQAFFWSIRAGVRAKAAMTAIVYDKVLRLNPNKIAASGEIVNLISNDAWRVFELCRFLHFSWGGPLALVAVGVLMWFEISWGAVTALGTYILFLPIQALVGKFLGKIRTHSIVCTDERVRKMSEILTSVKLVKLYAWEQPFADAVARLRALEVHLLRRAAFLMRPSLAVSWSLPVIVGFIGFATYVALGNELDDERAFTTLSLINSLRLPMVLCPLSLKAFFEGRVALGRLEIFLGQEELPLLGNYSRDDQRGHREMSISDDGEVLLTNAYFEWDTGEDTPANHGAFHTEAEAETNSGESRCVLRNLSFHVKPGQLVGIIGSFGSGKSSLLSALLGELVFVKGSMRTCSSLAYAPQQPFIQNGTLRDNILFGLPFQSKKYRQVIRACSLDPDLDLLPAGDLTEIGERGINVSGGQKARISLARAVYADKECYLLDDPLSAVDQHVGRSLFHNCISGLLKHKTIFFVTHQLQYLNRCDQVLILKDGQLVGAGSFRQLMRENEEFSKLLTEHHGEAEAVLKKSEEAEKLEADGFFEEFIDFPESKSEKVMEEAYHFEETDVAGGFFTQKSSKKSAGSKSKRRFRFRRRKRQTTEATEEEIEQRRATFQKRMDNWSKSGKIVVKEDRVTGSLSVRVLLDYIRAMGGLHVGFFITLTFVITQGARVASDWFLTYWVNDDAGQSDGWYIGIYGALVFAFTFLCILRNVLWTIVTLSAATSIHDSVFISVLRAPMSFFDSTPVGRILNRFSKDQDIIDEMLPEIALQFNHYLWIMIASFVFMIAVVPLFAVVLLPLGVIFWLVGRFYRRTSRELKRLDGITRSPVYATLSETLNGLSTIRAFGAQRRFDRENLRKVDLNHSSLFCFECGARWLGFRLDLLTALVVLAIGLFVAGTRSSLDASLAALAITYGLQLSGAFQWCVRTYAESESHLTSVERLVYYSTRLVSEAPAHIPEHTPQPSWPEEGVVSFNSVDLRYQPHLPLVLHSVSFTTKPQEKIGVVGRTGAAKSTLLTALFRLTELAGGNITIDGVNTSEIGLDDLRSRLAIVPQEPTLFVGTLRYNLDPFGTFDDTRLWEVLEQVHLSDFVSELPDKLEHLIVENGENLSVGERQLVCFARALLRNSKVLCLDESTASVDMETDKLVQKMIREAFKDCTILTVAHRLQTVCDSDRILVMDSGRVVEFGTPAELLADPNSEFSALVDQTGEKAAAQLRKIAAGQLAVFDDDVEEVNVDVPEAASPSTTFSHRPGHTSQVLDTTIVKAKKDP